MEIFHVDSFKLDNGKVGLKIFAIPIYLMPRSYEVSKVSGQKQLIDFGQAA